MENYSYIMIWFFFVMQILSVGLGLGKLGEPRTGVYSLGLIFFSALLSVLAGIAIYAFPKG